MAPAPDRAEVDLPEPHRPTTGRRHPHGVDRAHGAGEHRLVLPPDPGRTVQARPPGSRINGSPRAQAPANTARTPARHRHLLATVPPRPGHEHVGLRLLPRRLRHHPQTRVRLLRDGRRHPLRPHPRHHHQPRRTLDNPTSPRPAHGPRRPSRQLPVPRPRPGTSVHHLVRRGLLRHRHSSREDSTTVPASQRLRRAVIGTARREVTDRLLIINERHLRTVLDRYASHYNHRRPHRALQLAPPRPDRPTVEPNCTSIHRRPVLGGLINEYEHAVA
ncbi:integrase core domain-containing protein [Actinosynnema sp. NPDC004786]